jgi:hypothetical protein
VTDADSGFIIEPLLPLPDPEATLAGQLRRRRCSEDEIRRIYAEAFGAQGVELLGWDLGRRRGCVEFNDA